MKYIILGAAIIISVSWHMFQSNVTKSTQLGKIQIHGQVQDLNSSMVLNIQDRYLTLSAFDRFSFIAQSAEAEKLTMQIVTQPENQLCEIFKSTPTKSTMRLNISCKNKVNTDNNNSVIALSTAN